MDTNRITISIKGKTDDGVASTAVLLQLLLQGALPNAAVKFDETVHREFPEPFLEHAQQSFREELVWGAEASDLDEVMSRRSVQVLVVVENEDLVGPDASD